MKAVWTLPPNHLKTALSQYASALPTKTGINDLEQFLAKLRTELPTRKPPHITASEYSKLVKWKLMRGKWRPRLQKFADAVTDDVMIPASTSAFAAFENGETKPALRFLTDIRGCGPASASLVLALFGACFMGDEALEAALGERKYTEKAFMQLQEEVNDKCKQLGGEWNAWDLERAVFAAVKHGISNETNGSHKDEGEQTDPKLKQDPPSAETPSKRRAREEVDGKQVEDAEAPTVLRRSKRIRKKDDR